MQPRVDTGELQPGDAYDVVFTTSAGERHVPTVLAPYFVTTPAISSYAAGAAPAQTVAYPPAADAAGSSHGNPIALDATGKLSLTIWRPQRLAVPGAETGDFMDMGHLHYGLTGTTPDGSREVACAGYYSNLSPSLTQTAAGGQDFGAVALPADRQRRGHGAERRRHAVVHARRRRAASAPPAPRRREARSP